MNKSVSFRVVTYNIHKCVGLDRKLSPARVAEVIEQTSADVVALQEVVRSAHPRRGGDQLLSIARAANFPQFCFGSNRPHWGGTYGNAVLSRWPIVHWHNHDISIRAREPRGMLQADIQLAPGSLIHVLNLHLGTGFMERRKQAERLMGEEALLTKNFGSPRLLLGDFNEWTRGLATRRLTREMRSAAPIPGGKAKSETRMPAARRMRSYPGILPILHLDHIYYDEPLRLKSLQLHRTRLSLIASDHLPLVADFEVEL